MTSKVPVTLFWFKSPTHSAYIFEIKTTIIKVFFIINVNLQIITLKCAGDYILLTEL